MIVVNKGAPLSYFITATQSLIIQIKLAIDAFLVFSFMSSEIKKAMKLG